ncbi:MAG: response regulator [Magnetococcus sp. YQC-3]
MAEEDEELLAMFVQESTEHLENIEPNLLILEEMGAATDPDIINSLFRGVHSIKGSAGFFGLTAISKLSHIMENLLGKVRDKSIVPTAEVSDSLLSGLDKLKNMVHDVVNSESVDVSAEVAVIQGILERSGGGAPAQPAAAPPAPAAAPPAAAEPPAPAKGGDAPSAPAAAQETAAAAPGAGGAAPPFVLENFPSAVADAVRGGCQFFVLAVEIVQETEEEINNFINQFIQLVSSVGTVVETSPVLGAGIPKLPDRILRFLVYTVVTADLLQDLVSLPPNAIQPLPIPVAMGGAAPAPAATPAPTAAPVVQVEEVESAPVPVKAKSSCSRLSKPRPVQAGGGAAAARADDKPKSGQPAVEETLRVSVTLLDELINMAGELVLTRNQLTRATAGFVAQSPHLAALVQGIDSVTSRIHGKVMQARMQPVNVVFNKFPRIVRDLAVKLSKKIDLEVRGGEVELDKSVIEHLSDPLTHMIRNVADHAIELPKDRLAAGKPEAGKVELAAYHENGMVNIALIDDGAGIDSERIKTKAIEKGLITEVRAAEMSEEELLDLIFAPGFSMAKKVSDVSGRGVGMDVVRTNIEKLRGTVHIASKVGKGTRIILKLPLTLAIIPAMIVAAGKLRFAIPEIGLIEIVRVAETDLAKQIQMVCDAPVLSLRHTLLPLVDLATTLGLVTPAADGSGGPRWLESWQRQRAAGEGAAPSRLKESTRPGHALARHSQAVYVMVINVSGNTFGLVVDDVIDSEEIVVKPLPSYAKDTTCFSAVTILGDGSVASIIDYSGVVEKARINFSGLEAATADMEDVARAALREKQNIILLETQGGLVMGIVNNMVSRVEVIQKSQCRMETINHQSYMHYNHVTFHVLYPEQVLGLDGEVFGTPEQEEGREERGDTFCMVVPSVSGLQVGLIFSRIVDTMETYIDLDCRVIQADGLFGTARIDGRLVLFPDLNRLFYLAGILPATADLQADYDGFRALVVDDTPFLRIVTATYLSQAGFLVEQVEDGQQALQRLKSGPYDLVVTDINMPVMDGLELAKELPGTMNAETPMVATTSFISSDLATRCIRAGMVGCVPSTDKLRLLNMLATMERA